jgi:hypothetical protein
MKTFGKVVMALGVIACLFALLIGVLTVDHGGIVGFAIAAAGLVFAGSLIVRDTRDAGQPGETISAAVLS